MTGKEKYQLSQCTVDEECERPGLIFWISVFSVGHNLKRDFLICSKTCDVFSGGFLFQVFAL